MNRSLQKGFSLVITLLVVLVISAIAVSGWYVWGENKRNALQQSDTVPQTSETKSGGEKPADPTEGGKYLVIQEWDVRFLLPEELRGDIYYKAFTDTLGAQGTLFASKSLDSRTNDSSCSLKVHTDGSTGPGLSASLSRVNPEKPGEESIEFYRSQRHYLKTIGDYEYYSVDLTKSITCVSEMHPELNSIERAASTQLLSAFKNIEPADK